MSRGPDNLCSWRLALLAALVLTLGAPAWAQETEPPGETPPAAGSRQVDEEEETFRRSRRVEDVEEEGRDLADPGDLPPIPERELKPIDRLPPESREHLEEQMREVIMDVGQWQPGDAQEDYPYEPSEAAQADPQLAAEEQAVWEGMVEDYHEREERALARGEGAASDRSGAPAGKLGEVGSPDSGSQSDGQGTGNGSGNGSGGGQGGGSGSGSGSGSGRGQGSGAAPGAYSVERPAGEAAGPQGGPFSAMEFLRGLGRAPEQGAEGDGVSPNGSLPLEELEKLYEEDPPTETERDGG